MRSVNVLVDYDNVRSSPESRISHVVTNLSILVPKIAACIHRIIPGSDEASCRLYGGWTELNGTGSQQYGWLLGEISRFRGRREAIRLKMSMATELICRSDLSLIGTYRDRAQKMVDTMICADLVSLAEYPEFPIALVSDDEDFVPGIIASSIKRPRSNPIYVLRDKRSPGTAPNDALLAQCNVIIGQL